MNTDKQLTVIVAAIRRGHPAPGLPIEEASAFVDLEPARDFLAEYASEGSGRDAYVVLTEDWKPWKYETDHIPMQAGSLLVTRHEVDRLAEAISRARIRPGQRRR